MDLISRERAIDAVKHAWAKGLEPSQYIEIIPPVPAVPLDKLCEWLEKNACYYQTEDNGGSTRFSLDSCQWKIVLAKWMEEQDADRQ